MDLRKVDRLSRRERDGEAPRVARAVDVTISGDLERKPAGCHADTLGEARRDGAPRSVARRQREGRPSESSAAEPCQGVVVGEPARERRHDRAPKPTRPRTST